MSPITNLCFRKGLLYEDRSEFEDALHFHQMAHALLPGNILILMHLSRTEYELGNLSEANEFTRMILEMDKGHPAVSINFAFFGILEKNYQRVAHWYDRLLRMKKVRDVNPLLVAEFLAEKYEQDPSEHALLYGLAIVNGITDRHSRRKDLQAFLRKTTHRPEYETLRNRARDLLAATIEELKAK